jgi:hypothetical protein
MRSLARTGRARLGTLTGATGRTCSGYRSCRASVRSTGARHRSAGLLLASSPALPRQHDRGAVASPPAAVASLTWPSCGTLSSDPGCVAARAVTTEACRCQGEAARARSAPANTRACRSTASRLRRPAHQVAGSSDRPEGVRADGHRTSACTSDATHWAEVAFYCPKRPRSPSNATHPRGGGNAAIPPQARRDAGSRSLGPRSSHARGRWFDPSRAHLRYSLSA